MLPGLSLGWHPPLGCNELYVFLSGLWYLLTMDVCGNLCGEGDMQLDDSTGGNKQNLDSAAAIPGAIR